MWAVNVCNVSAAIIHLELRKIKPLAAPWLHMFRFKPLLVEDQNDNEKKKNHTEARKKEIMCRLIIALGV